jgi:hypothetical protein
MKRGALPHHIRRYGCILTREGAAHSLSMNPATGAVEAVPRHVEIANRLAAKICRGLTAPEVGRPSRRQPGSTIDQAKIAACSLHPWGRPCRST